MIETPPLTLDELRRRVPAFRERLLDIKRRNPPEGFTWYGYEIFGNVEHMNRLLTGARRAIFETVKDKAILDIGAADGDLAFFLESLGFAVDVIDLPQTNWNGLQGARRLRELLQSKVGIHEIDVDAPFELPRTYGLILFFGILYHLKNPFLALDRLSTRASHLFLSTRVARFTPGGRTPIGDVSVAYLLDPDEANNDATNWWIFSMAGLRKLVRRAGWEIQDECTVGDTKRSEPAAADHDERAFMLLRSLRFSG